MLGSAADVAPLSDDPACAGADVVLLDVEVPGSLAAVRRLSERRGAPSVVALAIPDDPEQVVACAEAGVHGYVTRDDPLADLVGVIESAARGGAPCSPRVAAALVRRVRALADAGPSDPGAAQPAPLTARELEIVALIGQGLSNKEIAARLRIQLPTVKNHVHNILGKLGVARRAEAVAHVRRHPRALASTAPLLLKD